MFVYDSGAGPVGIIAAGALTGILTACRRTGDFRYRALAANPHVHCSVVRGAGCIRWLSRDPWRRRADHAVRDLADDFRRDRFDCRRRNRLDADGNANARSVCTGKRRETGSTVSPGLWAGKCNGHSPLFSKLVSIGRCRMLDHDLEGISLRPGGLGVVMPVARRSTAAVVASFRWPG